MHALRLYKTGSVGSPEIDPSKRRWTNEELEFLKTNATTMKTKEIAKRLDRSPQAVRSRAHMNGWAMWR